MFQTTVLTGVCLLTTVGCFPVLGELRISSSLIGSQERHLSVKLGSRIELTCSRTDGDEEEEEGGPVTWWFEGEVLEPDGRRSIRGASISRVTIAEARLNDSGTYSCRDGRRGNDSDHVVITVTTETDSSYSNTDDKDDSSKVEIVNAPPDRTLTVEPGSSFTLRCTGDGATQLQWFHNGSRMTMTRQTIITSSLEISERRHVSLMTRNDVTDAAAGSYECRDMGGGGGGRHLSDDVTLLVRRTRKTRVPVEIFQPQGKLSRVLSGASVELKCRAEAASVDLVWFFNDTQPLLHNRHTVIVLKTAASPAAPASPAASPAAPASAAASASASAAASAAASPAASTAQRDTTSVLRLMNATRRDAGKYSCRSQTDAEATDYVMIIVDEVDHRDAEGFGFENGRFPVVPTSVIMQIGSVTNLQCSFQAPGDYRLEWTKDGQVLTNGEKYVINYDSKTISLGIRFTDRSDVGIYKCTFNHISQNKTAGIVVFNITTIPCPHLEPPSNGHLVHCSSEPVFGESCSFGCSQGYQINNSTPIVCERNQTGEVYWSNDVPQCIANPLISGEHQVPSTTSNVLLRLGSSLRLQCFGSKAWTKHRLPIENSTKYTIENNSLTIHDIDRDDAGIYDCSIYRDRLLIGVNKFNVTSLACPRRPLLPHGDVGICSDRPVYGERCVFQCHPGYTLHGSRQRSCELTGNETVPYWTGERAECLGPAKDLPSQVNSATSNNIPAKSYAYIFNGIAVFRFDRQQITSAVTSAALLLPHYFFR